MVAEVINDVTSSRNEQRYDRSFMPLSSIEGKNGRNFGYSAKDIINRAHHVGLTGTFLTLLNYEPNIPEAVFKATVTFDDGTSFEDIGDANPNNCGESTSNAICRMAATRALSRALGQAMGLDSNSESEFGGEVQPGGNPAPSQGRSSYRNQQSSGNMKRGRSNGLKEE